MQSVLRSGNYELPEIQTLPGFVTANDRVLELGAAIGFLGLYCRKIVKVRELVSVEPNPVTLEFLKQNYELNGFTPRILPVALTHQDGPVTMYVSEMFWSDSLISQANAPAAKAITVQGLSLESLTRLAGIEFNTMIVDIEGGEMHLPVDSLPKQVEKVLIELHPEITGERVAFAIVERLIRAGFSLHAQNHRTWAFRRDGARNG